jgi:diguanylate cyclase
VVARLGGDEFVVVLAGVRAREAHRIALATSTALGAPYSLSGLSLQVGATVGYALAPGDGRDLKQLLRIADAAMYRGKAMGRGQVVRALPQADALVAQPA